ncbi:MAG: hypothetical protein JW740_01835 [Candidatus Zambryskibacteria bacterium]|nr:hypothetical protein [Candidatus Zambryskibacteria bacterium]
MKKINRNITIVLIIILTFSFLPINKANAFLGIGDIVLDPSNLVQNTVTAGASTWTLMRVGLDAAAWMLINTIIDRVTASTIDWINSGFEGSPAFVTDPEAYFIDIGDKVAGQYIFNDPNLNFLCDPISTRIRLALAKSYLNERSWQCTLTEVGENMEDFMGDFSKGGWDSFYEISQNQHMNPIGAYLQAESEMYEQITSEQEAREMELDWGKGFFSFRECTKRDPKTGDCIEYNKNLSTPGAAIETQLNNALNMGNERLAVADEINEIVGALITQLVGKVFSSSGLISLSDSSGGKSTTRQLLETTAQNTTDYFGNVQSTTTPEAQIQPVSKFYYNQTLEFYTTVTPIDNDCSGIDITPRVDNYVNALLNMNLPKSTVIDNIEDYIENIDCDPPGIN